MNLDAKQREACRPVGSLQLEHATNSEPWWSGSDRRSAGNRRPPSLALRPSGPAAPAQDALGPVGNRAEALVLAVALYLVSLNRTVGENYLDYRYENYQEDSGRIGVNTHAWLFEDKLVPWLSVKGLAVYDAISGATPTGGPTPNQAQSIMLNTLGYSAPGTPGDQVPLAQMHDKRWAGSMDAILTLGPHRLTPEFSYSSEHDYLSYGAALNYSVDLNAKNTTLNLGCAHDWDTVLPANSPFLYRTKHKDTDQLLVGVNQLLSPKTVLSANFSFATARGYLSDPYRGVMFDESDQYSLNNLILYPEKRPGHRQSYVPEISLKQYLTPLHAAVEGSYRYYWDTYGIAAHTVELAWRQKVWKVLQVSPVFRYYRQSAASFYAVHFPGDFVYDPAAIPANYSSDYRLSELETFSAGVELSARVRQWLTLGLSYKRYEMHGLDGITSPSAYPKANVVTIGARIWF